MVASVRLAAQAVAVVGFLVSASAAMAQDVSQIINRLNRLERDLADTQREVFRPSAKPRTGSVTSTPLTPNAAAPASTGEVPLIARHEIRLQQLENQLRGLTGRIEEFSFSINQFGKRLDRLVSDVDYRLQRLEAAQAAGGPIAKPMRAKPPPVKTKPLKPPPRRQTGAGRCRRPWATMTARFWINRARGRLARFRPAARRLSLPRRQPRRASRRRPPRKSPPCRRRSCRPARRASAIPTLSACCANRTTPPPRPLLKRF